MRPVIAIPLPLSTDSAYVERALPQYEDAVRGAGGDPVRVPLDRSREEVMSIVRGCDGVLLPGASADVDPEKYATEKSEATEASDRKREAVDELLLEHAYEQRKPILAICYGLQILNVKRAGNLIQHIPDSVAPEQQRINHAAGRKVPVAHAVSIDRSSRLAKIVDSRGTFGEGMVTIPVNSSHHQSADRPGEGLRVVARCPDDGIIEALEGTAADHFVLAVQWHPERSEDEASRAIFREFVAAARK